MRTEDGYIINKCLDGDSTAFGFLVDKYKESIYAFVYERLHNFHDAEDVTQEVFTKAYQKLRTLRRWDKVLPWLYSIASNQCKMAVRANSRRPDHEFIKDQDLKIIALHSVEPYINESALELLHEALNSLPEIYRQALTLHYLGDMSTMDIAKFVGSSPTAIRKRLSKGRSMLKTEMVSTMRKIYRQKRLQAGFTFRIVQIVKHIKIQPLPKASKLPWGLGLIIGTALFAMGLSPFLNLSDHMDTSAGAPLRAESLVLKTGEIPVDIVEISHIPFISVKEQGEGIGIANTPPDQSAESESNNGELKDSIAFEDSKKGTVLEQMKVEKYTENPILPREWEGVKMMEPSVIYAYGKYRMWYCTQADDSHATVIEHATSQDGIKWIEHGVVVKPEYDWEKEAVRRPRVIIDKEEAPEKRYKMWYVGSISHGIAVGYATSPNGISWSKYPKNPAISQMPINEFTDPLPGSVIRDDGAINIWYSAMDEVGKRRIFYATSQDGINWENHTQVNFGNTAGDEVQPFYASGFCVARQNDIFHLWYINDSGNLLNHVESPDGVNWGKHSGENVLSAGKYGLWDGKGISDITVLLRGNESKMWYTGDTGGVGKPKMIGYASNLLRKDILYKHKGYPIALAPADITVTLLDESYDDLENGEALPGWSNGVLAQGAEFVSIPMGAKIDSTVSSAFKSFLLARGNVVFEICMKSGSNSNASIGLCVGNANEYDCIFHKNAENKWSYRQSSSMDISSVSFADCDDKWHHFKLIYNTPTNKYDLYMDDKLVADDIPYEQDLSDGISHIGICNNKVNIAASYFDDLKIYTLGNNGLNDKVLSQLAN